MDLEEIKTTNGLYDIQAKTSDGNRIADDICFIASNSSTISMNGKSIELVHKNQKLEIERLLSLGTPHVCYFNSIFNDGNFSFSIHCFAGRILNWGNVIIAAEKNNLETLNHDLQNIQFKIADEDYFIIHSSFEKGSDNNDAPNDFAFSIIDGKKLIDVGKLNIEDKMCYQTKRRPRNSRNALPQSNYFLVKGKLEFNEKGKFISEYKKVQLETIMQKGGSYLDAWRKYTSERGNILLERARKIGKINFTRGEDKTESGAILYLNEEKTDLKLLENQNITIYDSKSDDPIFIKDKSCSWNDYLSKKKEEVAKKKEERKAAQKNNDENSGNMPKAEVEIKPIEAEVVKVTSKSISIKTDSDTKIPQKGFFVISTLGDEKQLERQNNAWQNIAEGRSGIQHLGALLETNANILQTQHQRGKIKLSSAVYEKVFSRTEKDGTKKVCPPTENQLEAIDVALRTPDIALIQGPPGTGKTTVITAILEQLNVMQDKHKNSAGRVLATSYQHDAVINMTDRLRINSLPTYKFGSKHGQEKYTEHIEDWTKKLISRVLEKNPSLKTDKDTVTISSCLADYKMQPTSSNARTLLEAIYKTASVSTDLSNRAKGLLSENSDDLDSLEENINDENLLKAVRALRVTEDSFDDDGKERAIDLYSLLESKNYFESDANAKKLLRNAATFSENSANENQKDEMLKQLRILKNKLLEEFSYKPFYVVNQINPEIVSITEEALDYIHKSFSNTCKKNQILSEWLSLLENNPWGLESAIKDCDFVYASSAQQSVSKEILNQKTNVDPSFLLYDTVVIDEAARAAPPDLLIPMCLATKRIILVGDHRQLPQLVDEDICRAIETQSNGNQNTETSNTIDSIIKSKTDPLHLSMFELLFSRLKELEKKDGIKRTVTLNRQFRTHPVLGDFASKEFYEKYPGEGYSSDSESVSRFSHKLSGIENKAAVWIDVPNSKGKEEKPGTSYCRPAEVSEIVKRLKEWAESEEGKSFSYGIITFYKEQANVLQKEISKLNLNIKYRIGSVDAFQGMEFDVVFLSVVRSNKLKIDNPYGFLCSTNRLCVSMSRQKKVLVCVGDKDFCTSENARKEGHIPALAHFYDLCSSSEWGIVL